MKTILKTCVVSTLTIILSTSDLSATTITWNGGFGFWGQANRWSTGTVPGPDDYVIIQNGFVIIGQNFNAQAKGVEVSGNSAFRIESNAVLTLHDGEFDQTALTNNGITFNFGTIDIDGYEGTGFSTHVGIVNNNFFRNFPAGSIIARNLNNDVIKNGISETFINEGYIDINVPYDIYASSIQSSGVFENREAGVIYIENGTTGISCSSLGTSFVNKGKIVIVNPGASAISNNTDAHNFSTGSISIVGGQLFNGDYFHNEGTIALSQYNSTVYPALYNRADMDNDGGIIIYNVQYAGIVNGAWQGNIPSFNNNGAINIFDIGDIAIFNQGDFHNLAEGYIVTDNYLKGGDYVNDGIFKNTFAGYKHSITLTNNGIFNDKFGKLNYNSVSNNGVIVRPIQGPLSAGTYVYNAFDVGNSNAFTFSGNWIDEIWGGNNCGPYDVNGNWFYPYIQAENEDELYAHITINSSGRSDYFDIVVLNSSNRFIPELNNNASGVVDNSFMTFPNPAQAQINIEWGKAFTNADHIFVYDALGNLIHQEDVDGKSMQHKIILPAQIADGMYYIIIQGPEGKLGIQRVVVSK